jgi:uroporphyrinogen decarboxylase
MSTAEALTSKERVHRALRRQPVDRVPVWMWFHPDTARRLAAALEVHPANVADAMGDDIRQTWVGNNHAMEGIVHEREGETHLDDWGVEWVREGPFNQILRSPLQSAPPAALPQYRFPHGHIPQLLSTMEPVMAAVGSRFIGCDVSPCLLEMLFRLRGMEQTLLDLVANRVEVGALLHSAARFSVELSRAACDRFAVDWLWLGDDVGSQRSLLLDPTTWRDVVRPRLAEIAAVGRGRGLWVAYHTCGAVRPLIPDLIDSGIQVLNPIQCNCPGMDPLELKREFGDRLAFHGGIDTQHLLPMGTAREVFRATRTLVEGMSAQGGGYILGASHAVPPETPLVNLFAIYAAADISREEIQDRAADIRARQTQAGKTARGAMR